ncbi:MAG TPA: Nif3-like dinuclear metal center hexameric protein [Bacteroidales bacterium]|nr:MAG: Nif3-like dinuclear metal center hexameric protein [Bacteroidetes bacterium GWE2_42_24]OFY27295.1 MAG: Nif3-like dinuclear metal center hexameric protein [Bacteroidetes bacterium GWF2_43_11]HAQ65082.1 Nif3-like dinuclear metal center hexameric protein [Bacteroidales bacterium]HBZ65959.1 Nif3-like dinuclear metal center hexameric protein [Bacteroidales bacterium]
MSIVNDLWNALCLLAHPSLQEEYDNSGLITGDRWASVTGVLVSFDVNEAVIDEAIERHCNVIVAHHPALFRPLKQITSDTSTGRILLRAIRNNIALIAMHTNLDNHLQGVNRELGKRIGLSNLNILSKVEGKLRKLTTFVPTNYTEAVRSAMFEAGAGNIGHYDSCSYNTNGTGTFRAGEHTNPFVGERNNIHFEPEVKIEVVYPQWLEKQLVETLKRVHPYEEVAYDLFQLQNEIPVIGAGMIGTLDTPMKEESFLDHLKTVLGTPGLRHTKLSNRMISSVAICGGSGSFLIRKAASAGADAFVTGDVKYHEFFESPEQLLLVDAGHYETEQFTVQLLAHYLTENFPNFAVLISNVNTNPVHYA